ncbi:MAG: hypothetical protein LAO51_16025 [Acidobacteriia bacterium]|nr:hypothetical protein [Terriglobia bacterium]
MAATRIDDLVWDLEPEELPDALRLLAALEKAGWVSAREASEWRGHIAALRFSAKTRTSGSMGRRRSDYPRGTV